MVAYNLAKCNKPFLDGKFIKQCMVESARVMSPDVKSKFESISLSRRTVVHGIDSIQFTEQLMIASKDFVYFSLALDESTDEEDTTQLLIFVHGINRNFVNTEELFGLASMKNTPTSNTCLNTLCIVWKNNLSWNKIAGITTDGAKAFTEKKLRCKQ